MKYLKRFLIVLVYLLPAALYCSYYPIIKLGETNSMNFELSLPLIWLVLFDIISFIALLLLTGNKKRRSLIGFGDSRGPFSGIFATNGERTKRRAARNDGTAQACPEKIFVNHQGISDRRFFLFSLFPFFATLSIFWSANPTRAILTAGIIWLVFFAVFSLIYVLPLLKLPGNFKRNCLRSFFIASVIACLICWVQCFLDIAGLARETTLMCRGCTYLSFGFPHPSGLAIEPQFMGNLLLAPTLTSLYLLIFNAQSGGEKKGPNNRAKSLSVRGSGATARKSARHLRRQAGATRPERKRDIALVMLCLLFSSTLFLTFSRGAIYAYAVALVIMLIFAIRRHVFRASLVTIPIATFLVITGIQGIFTVIGPTHGSFIDGVSKSIHQLSLGIIDIRPKSPSVSAEDSSETTPVSPPGTSESSSDSEPSTDQALTETTPEEPENAENQPYFEGYVAESTTARLNLNRAALDTWLSAPGHAESSLSIGLHCHFFLPGTGPACTASVPLTPTSALFGVGLGGAGTAMYLNSFITGINSPKEIVQHQGFSLLLELGLVGIALAIFSLLIAFFPQFFSRRFLDGKTAKTPKSIQKSEKTAKNLSEKASPSPFWRHPALPLLVSLIIAYLVTLNFFSGLPNALQIYLMPPLLYYIFVDDSVSQDVKKPKKALARSSDA